MKKIDKVLEDMQLLRSIGIVVPAIVEINLRDIKKEVEGTVQVWKCKSKKCWNWEYQSPIPALSIECPKGHPAYLHWDIKDSTHRA